MILTLVCMGSSALLGELFRFVFVGRGKYRNRQSRHNAGDAGKVHEMGRGGMGWGRREGVNARPARLRSKHPFHSSHGIRSTSKHNSFVPEVAKKKHRGQTKTRQHNFSMQFFCAGRDGGWAPRVIYTTRRVGGQREHSSGSVIGTRCRSIDPPHPQRARRA